ncbi:Kinase-like protein [Mycena sanguinolenta]|uniref:Kinase-like protein n=1 Tax=Mycena sanguinolenta TaxID=230812 RepID=A0A8H6U1S5_9AGAR|nr:Kinase-like protein [Mycena sanguinolenta]
MSTSDCTESAPYSSAVFPQAGGLTRNAKLVVNSIGSLPSFQGDTRVTEPQTSETSRIFTGKYSETIAMRAVDGLVTNNYYINGGVGGSGGGARDHGTGGSGGAGHGPTVYIGETSRETLSPFQTIRLGDLDLVKELRLDGRSSVVGQRKVTVAMYQGDSAEKEWRRDQAAYESIRHPNILQLYGLVNTKKLYAMVFHNELVPYEQFRGRFEHSPILTTYIWGYCLTEYEEARYYHSSIFQCNPSIYLKVRKQEVLPNSWMRYDAREAYDLSLQLSARPLTSRTMCC